MLKAFLADCARYNDNKPLTLLRAIQLTARYHGLQALLGYRLGQTMKIRRRSVLFWPVLPLYWLGYILISCYVRTAFDIRLSSSADIAPGLYIGHFGGILVEHCIVGRHCNVGQSTRIGALDGKGPTIGDRVWIGPHAQVMGPYSIGSGSTVGAGAVVKRDLPENALSMGIPARVVQMGYDNTLVLGAPYPEPTGQPQDAQQKET